MAHSAQQSTGHGPSSTAAHSSSTGCGTGNSAQGAQMHGRHSAWRTGHRTQHTVCGGTRPVVCSTNRHRAQHIVHDKEQQVHSTRCTVHRAHAYWCCCTGAARPRYFLWGCQYGTPLRRIAPLGRPTP